MKASEWLAAADVSKVLQRRAVNARKLCSRATQLARMVTLGHVLEKWLDDVTSGKP